MIKILDEGLHAHLKARMAQRGVLREEIQKTLDEGWKAKDAKTGTFGKESYSKKRRLPCIINLSTIV